MLPPVEEIRILRISTAGSVDDGKSTLIGRLLYDSKAIFEDQVEALERTSKHRGDDEVNLALLTDGLRAEREQGITIDVAYRYFATPKRRFIIADTPGHAQYTRNMITGASNADVAIILIDVRNGMTDQSRRHAFVASLLRIPYIVVVVNKMDAVGYDEGAFGNIVKSFEDFAAKLDLPNLHFIPVSALKGDNVVEGSDNMPWYTGMPVLEYLEQLYPDARKAPQDLRLPVQYVIRPNQDFRGFAGRLSSGVLRAGEEVMLLPSSEKAVVKELFELGDSVLESSPRGNVVFTLDRQVDLSRGDMVVRPRNLPSVSQTFEAIVCWMSGEPARIHKPYILRHTTREVTARVDEVVYRFNVETLHRDATHSLHLNDIGRVVITTGKPLFLDTFEHNRSTGSFVLIDTVTNNVVAAGTVTRSAIERAAPDAANRAPLVLWFTGLSGAGKSTIADAVYRRLSSEGNKVARLDGDDLRTGLNSDLGFTPEDRRENLRRSAHVAKLYANLGNITLCSFISPLESDRALVREIVGEGFREVYVKTDVEECERRDPKGLYKRARAGEIPQFTGVSAPYEAPRNPELVLDTAAFSVEDLVNTVLQMIDTGRHLAQ